MNPASHRMMGAAREWLARLCSTVRPGRRDEDLAEELRLHLELVAEDARRRGHDPDEAMRLARLEAGGREQAMDALRDQRGLRWLEDAGRDAAYGLRALARHPGFTATAILSLALGVGANAGIFSIVDQVLLRLLPVREPERLVLFDWNGPSVPRVEVGEGNLISYPLCLDLQERTEFFEGVFCRHPGTLSLSAGGEYELVEAELVSGSYFGVLGIQPERRRLIGPSDDQRPGEHQVVVVSHDYWKDRLGSSADVVGRRVLVNRHPMTVIGVAPPGFRGMDAAQPADVWLPATMAREATIEFDRIFESTRVLDAGIRAPAAGRRSRGGRRRDSALVRVRPGGGYAARGVPARQPRTDARVSRVDARRDSSRTGLVVSSSAGRRSSVGAPGGHDAVAGAGLPQRREPAPRAWRRAHARTGHAHGARRVPRPPHTSADRRRSAHRVGRRTGRPRARAARIEAPAAVPPRGP